VRAGGLDGLDHPDGGARGAAAIGVEHAPQRIDDIARIERRAVVKAHALADIEAPHGAVRVGAPAGGEIGRRGAVRPGADEAALDLLDDLDHAAGCGRVEARLRAVAHIVGVTEGAARLGVEPRRADQGHEGDQKRAHGDRRLASGP